MKVLSASVAAASMAIMLSGCIYYPDGPYGPGYGPYHRATYDRPPLDSPPPPNNAGAPPDSYGQQGSYDGAPAGDYGPPPNGGPDQDQDQGYGPQAGGPDSGAMSDDGADSKADKAMAKINNPKWCAKHQQKCERLRAKYGSPDQPPPDQSGYQNQPGYH